MSGCFYLLSSYNNNLHIVYHFMTIHTYSSVCLQCFSSLFPYVDTGVTFCRPNEIQKIEMHMHDMNFLHGYIILK